MGNPSGMSQAGILSLQNGSTGRPEARKEGPVASTDRLPLSCDCREGPALGMSTDQWDGPVCS